jgi:hypothetical protein
VDEQMKIFGDMLGLLLTNGKKKAPPAGERLTLINQIRALFAGKNMDLTLVNAEWDSLQTELAPKPAATPVPTPEPTPSLNSRGANTDADSDAVCDTQTGGR